jgi:ABC-type nitrate/sulfonate/bicarbonate transport system ATPase subunit
MIAFRGLSVSYGDTAVLRELSLETQPGRILVLVGRSGCGKTTLLRAAAGLIHPRSPGLTWSGRVEGRTPATAMIFQDLGLLPWKTVAQNIELPLRWAGVKNGQALVAGVVQELGLERHVRAWPHELSGGLAQRVAIARALVLRPEVLLMDEPFSALDALTREQAQDTLWSLWSIHRPTVLLVTHSIEEAVVLGHRVAVMAGTGPGRLEAVVDLDFGDAPPHQRRLDSRLFESAATIRRHLETDR